MQLALHPHLLAGLLNVALGVHNDEGYFVVVHKRTKTAAEPTEIFLSLLADDELFGNVGIVDIEHDPLLQFLFQTEEGLVNCIIEHDFYNVFGGQSIMLEATFIALIAGLLSFLIGWGIV